MEIEKATTLDSTKLSSIESPPPDVKEKGEEKETDAGISNQHNVCEVKTLNVQDVQTSPASNAEMIQTISEDGDIGKEAPNRYRDVVRGMDEAYCYVSDEHTCDVRARRIFARKAALAASVINVSFLICGALFFASQTDWAAVDVALFTVYTVTSAGYGHVDIPNTPLFQIVDTFYILIGLSLMAIMMAQGYQFLELEAKQLQYASYQAEVLQRGIEQLKQEAPSKRRNGILSKLKHQKQQKFGSFGKCLFFLTRVIVFSVENPWGDFLCRIASLSGLALFGAIVVGSIEGWSWYTSFYWSVVSLTTVGYGDVVPETVAGKVITTLWLPLNLFFLSILFCSVGRYYLHFADRQIETIKKRLLEKREVEVLEKKSKSSDTSDATPKDLETGIMEVENQDSDDKRNKAENPPIQGGHRTEGFRGSVIRTSVGSTRSIDLPLNRRFFGAHLETMKEVIDYTQESTDAFFYEDDHVGEMDDPTAITLHGEAPAFQLRIKVKERLAYIVAEEVAGRQSSLTTDDKVGVLSVFLGGTVEAGEKWMIPRGARRAFGAVALEALLFVGENTLVNAREEALYQLSPMEFHRIFSPVLVAMGDKDCLEGWLASTDILWEKTKTRRRERKMSTRSLHTGHKDFAKSGEKVEFPTNHAEGFHLFRGA